MNDGVNTHQVCGALLFLRCALAGHFVGNYGDLPNGNSFNYLHRRANKSSLEGNDRRNVVRYIGEVFPKYVELFSRRCQVKAPSDLWSTQNVLRFWMRFGSEAEDGVPVNQRCTSLKVHYITLQVASDCVLRHVAAVDTSDPNLIERVILDPFCINPIRGNVILVRRCVLCHVIPQATYTFACGTTGGVGDKQKLADGSANKPMIS